MYPAETRCGSAIGPPLPRTVIDNLRCVIVISEPAWAVNANQKLPSEGRAAKFVGRVGAELDVEAGRKAA
jgi:hypothetical protein